MAILGKIRQQSIFLIIVIGLALFAFIISGAIGTGTSSSDQNRPVGIINDENIPLENFKTLVEQEVRSNGSTTIQAVNSVWDQYLESLVLKSQFDILGIDAGKNQIEQTISNTESIIKDERFINEAGFFDFGLFSDFIFQMRDQNPTAYEQWKIQEANIIGSAKQSIYFDLIRSSISVLDSDITYKYGLENNNVDIKFVKIPYSSIQDSLINVSEDEIDEYISKNKDKYEFKPIRDLDYVSFIEKPSIDDENIIRNSLDDLLEDKIEYNEVSKLTDTVIGFKKTNQVIDFVDRYSEIEFDSTYLPKGRLALEYGEILFNLKIGDVYGPYKEMGTYKISRLLDKKKNGSIRARQILISYGEGSRALNKEIRTKDEAKKIAQNIYKQALRRPKDFPLLAINNSDGFASESGGDLGYFQEKTVNKKIFEYADKSKIGSIGIIETEFGFHILKIVDKQDILLFANISKKIIPSEKTSNQVFREASQFEMDLSKNDDFNSTAQSKNYNVRNVRNLDILDENIPGLPNQRSIVQWAFNEDTKVGMIKKFNLSYGGYAIVQLINSDDNGLISSTKVRDEVREKLMKAKKSDLIINSNKNENSLEDLAAKNRLEINEASSLKQVNEIIVGAGREPYILGSAFSLKKGKVSDLIKGENGVYKIELVEKRIIERVNEDQIAYQNIKQKLFIDEQNALGKSILDALKKSAEITDNRALFY
ncbi:MAG: peptidylprolyl isomerase [Flavobacteriaceae bacterium]